MSVKAKENYLGGSIDEDSQLFKNLLVEPSSQNDVTEPESKLVAPTPGWCIKTWFKTGDKLFINICTSNLILKPKDLSEVELRKIIEDEDPSQFRIPMGIGEKHEEKDNSGKDVSVYDIVIHPSFFEKCKTNSFFKEFFIMLVFDGLEDKYELHLNREYTILKNRKSLGTLQMQNVRSKSKPFILEMDPTMYEMEKQQAQEQATESHMNEVSTKKTTSSKIVKNEHITPTFTLIQEPSKGQPEYLVIEVELPNQKNTHDMTLDVGEDALLLYANGGNYELDIDLPHMINVNATGAQFNKKTRILSVTMPVLPTT